MDDIYLEIKIDRSAPVDLIELADSLYALASFYKRFAKEESGEEETRLLVDKISEGSIIAKFVTFAEKVPHLESSKLLKFAKKIDGIVDLFFAGENTLNDNESKNDKLNYKDFSKFINIASDDNKGNVEIKAYKGSKVYVNIDMDTQIANVIQNRMNKHLEKSSEIITGVQTKETFYWFQARVDANAKSGDKGIIERITRKPLPVIFEDDSIKSDMMADTLFSKAYIVDVEIATVEGNAASYKIIRIHQTIDKPTTTTETES